MFSTRFNRLVVDVALSHAKIRMTERDINEAMCYVPYWCWKIALSLKQ